MKWNPKVFIGLVAIGVGLVVILEKFASEEGASDSAQAFSQPSTSYSSDEQDRLIRELRNKVADLEGKLQVAKSKKKLGGREVGFESTDVNIDALGRILFPDNPTKENLKAYVQAILEASKHQKSASTKDPQLEMLKKLGSENTDILINLLDDYKWVSQAYLLFAIEDLATETHKDLILGAIANNKNLIDTVYKFGWQNNIKDLIISDLSKNKYLKIEWLQAAASFNDPKANEGLVQHFMNSEYPMNAYRVISRIPEIKLTDEQVAKAWKNALTEDVFNATGIASLAADHGQVDALGFLIKNLNHANVSSFQKEKILHTISKTTGMSGSIESLQQWYEQAKSRLVFDPATRRYQIR
jgi:hypothetical protein